MQKRIELLRILNNMIIVWVAATILFMAVKMPMDAVLFTSNALLCLFLIISEVVQYFTTKIVTFIPGHILGIVLCIWLGRVIGNQPFGYTAARTIIMIAITIFAIHGRITDTTSFYPTISEGFFFMAMMIASKASGTRQAEIMVLLFEVVWGILMVIFYNTRQTALALSAYKRQAKVPYEAITRTNRFMMYFYLAVTTVVMFLCSMLDYGKEVMAAVKTAIVAFLRWFFSHFTFTEEEIPELPEPEFVQGGQQFIPIPQEENALIKALWDILFGAVTIAVFAAIVYTLYKVIRSFIREFNSRRSGIRDKLGRDKVEFLNPLSKEGAGDNGDFGSNRMNLRTRLSARGNVRRLFKNYIVKGSGFGNIRTSETPKELEESAVGAVNSKEKGQDPVALYEKARYSSLPISSDDVKLMKRLVR